jgi:hypothetical protein
MTRFVPTILLAASLLPPAEGAARTELEPAVGFEGLSGVRVPVTVGFRLLDDFARKDAFDVRVFGGGSALFVTSVDATGLSKSDVESPTYRVFAGAGVDLLPLF